MSSVIDLLGDPHPMLESIYIELERLGLPKLSCDHICYRVASVQRYEEVRAALMRHGTLEAETLVNGRPICIFLLRESIGGIACLELPAPKQGSTYAEGWEHAEFVTGESLNNFMAKYPQVNFDTKSLQKPINPEVAVKISADYQAKFHEHSILEVIELERNIPELRFRRET